MVRNGQVLMLLLMPAVSIIGNGFSVHIYIYNCTIEKKKQKSTEFLRLIIRIKVDGSASSYHQEVHTTPSSETAIFFGCENHSQINLQ